ncbi:MAG: hypothetical protein JNL70_25105 [Saprospiraceae bacterium]|nr:hypothetical protein [Saprospiraceae bacterium]
MKILFYSFLLFLLSSTTLLAQSHDNRLHLGVGTAILTRVPSKKGFYLEGEYSHKIRQKLFLTSHVNMAYSSGIGWGNLPTDSLFIVANGFTPINSNLQSIFRDGYKNYIAHTWMAFEAIGQISIDLNLLKSPNDELTIGSGILLAYITHTQIQQDGIASGKDFLSLGVGTVPNRFVVVAPFYARFLDFGQSFSLKYKHFFKNNLSIGLGINQQRFFSSGDFTFSLATLIGFRF